MTYESEVQTTIEELSAAIARRGLATPVIFMLEAHRPLRGVSAALWPMITPMLMPFVGQQLLGSIERVLAEPQAIDCLILALEAATSEAHARG